MPRPEATAATAPASTTQAVTPASRSATSPRLALTLGDVAGIGPEIVVRTLADAKRTEAVRPLVIGHPEILRQTALALGIALPVHEVADARLAFAASDGPEPVARSIPCWNPAGDAVLSVRRGAVQAAAGQAAYDYLVAATRAALREELDGLVTAPLHKEALQAAGLNYPGHTEILGAECGVRDVAMMLYLPPGVVVRGRRGLGVAHTTLHTSIRSVPGLLSTERIRDTILVLHRFLEALNGPARIGVAALNPHGGEHGLFGDEEERVIAPAIEQARAVGIDAQGPIPADALLRRAVGGEFDGVVAMYHDQGHIALKLIGFDQAVNVTLGLPIVRTSPSHGTAFDIAGQGRASAEGMQAALAVAAQLARRRLAARVLHSHQ